jgi:hypothetical protein
MSEPEYDQTEQRLDSLERTQEQQNTKLDSLIDKIDRFIGGKPVTHDRAQHDTEERLDRPSSVAEQVRAELAKAEQDRASQSAAEDEKAEREQMKADLAALREKPPAPPQPRRQRVMWGSR